MYAQPISPNTNSLQKTETICHTIGGVRQFFDLFLLPFGHEAWTDRNYQCSSSSSSSSQFIFIPNSFFFSPSPAVSLSLSPVIINNRFMHVWMCIITGDAIKLLLFLRQFAPEIVLPRMKRCIEPHTTETNINYRLYTIGIRSIWLIAAMDVPFVFIVCCFCFIAAIKRSLSSPRRPETLCMARYLTAEPSR